MLISESRRLYPGCTTTHDALRDGETWSQHSYSKSVESFLLRKRYPFHYFLLACRCWESSQSLRDPSAHGRESVPSCQTSWCLKLLTFNSEAAKFSRYPQFTMSKSPDHLLVARNKYPMKIPVTICLSNWCSLSRQMLTSLLVDVKMLVLKSREISFEHDRTRKGKGKGHRLRRLVQRENSAQREDVRKTVKKFFGRRR